MEIIQLLALTLFQYSTATVVGNRTASPVKACETMLNIVSGGSYARIKPIIAKTIINWYIYGVNHEKNTTSNIFIACFS